MGCVEAGVGHVVGVRDASARGLDAPAAGMEMQDIQQRCISRIFPVRDFLLLIFSAGFKEKAKERETNKK